MLKKFKVVSKFLMVVALFVVLCGCTEADKVSHNISKEADLFNVTRKITVLNTRTDNVLFEMVGTFSLSNTIENELEVICQVGENEFKKHFIYLNKWTTYVVEDISGSNVDKFKYELNILPRWGIEVTHKE